MLGRDAQAESVHQRVGSVAGVEVEVAAHGGHADAVAVKSDAADDAFGNGAILRVIGRAEAQRVQDGEGARAHGEDVAQDAAHAGGRALEGLNEAGVVVRLDFEDGGQPVADVHHAGVLARALQDLRAAGGQALEVDAAGLVGAVLAPHHAEDAELGEVGLAAEDFLDAGVLFGRQPVLGHYLGSYGCLSH